MRSIVRFARSGHEADQVVQQAGRAGPIQPAITCSADRATAVVRIRPFRAASVRQRNQVLQPHGAGRWKLKRANAERSAATGKRGRNGHNREPSGSWASTIGDRSSIRRPGGATSRCIQLNNWARRRAHAGRFEHHSAPPDAVGTIDQNTSLTSGSLSSALRAGRTVDLGTISQTMVRHLARND